MSSGNFGAQGVPDFNLSPIRNPDSRRHIFFSRNVNFDMSKIPLSRKNFVVN